MVRPQIKFWWDLKSTKLQSLLMWTHESSSNMIELYFEAEHFAVIRATQNFSHSCGDDSKNFFVNLVEGCVVCQNLLIYWRQKIWYNQGAVVILKLLLMKCNKLRWWFRCTISLEWYFNYKFHITNSQLVVSDINYL